MRATLYACSLSSRKRSLSEPMCRAKWEFVAKATALGVRVPQAELFVAYRKSQESWLPEQISLWNKQESVGKKDKYYGEIRSDKGAHLRGAGEIQEEPGRALRRAGT